MSFHIGVSHWRVKSAATVYLSTKALSVTIHKSHEQRQCATVLYRRCTIKMADHKA